MALNPTHIKFKSGADGTGYAELKPGTTWKAAKTTAEHLTAAGAKNAKPVRRK